MTPGPSQRTDTTYDLGGRATSVDDGFTCATHTYDYRDLELTVTDGLTGGTCTSGAASRTITTSLDGLGRITRSEVTAGADTGDRPVDLTLDAVGNQLTKAVKKSGSTSTATFTINLLDQVQSEARADGSTAKANYDPAGNVTDRCFWKAGITVGSCLPAGTSSWTNPPTTVTTTTSDARNGRIGLVDAAANETTTYDPDHDYQPSAIYLPTAPGREHQQLFSYDSRHRLTGITDQLCVISSGHACGSTTATGSDTYSYDNADNRTQVNESNGSTSADRRYCYDALNQLIYRNTSAACSSGANDESFTYDDAGNRLTATSGGVTTNFAYSADGQLCDVETAPTAASCTGGHVTYDSAGRTATYSGWTFGYDAAGRLTSACKSSTCAGGFDRVEMAYDGEGHRTQLKETAAGGTVTTYDFRYQGDAVVEELKNGNVIRDYVVDEAGRTVKVIVPVAVGVPDPGTYLVVWNGHGDAISLQQIQSDGTLSRANSYTYSSWGTPTTTVETGFGDLGFRFLYVGAGDVQWDNGLSLGLTYMHARHYSPVLGRFLQPDPARAETYAYVSNGPVTKVDPTGLYWYPVGKGETIRSVSNRLDHYFTPAARIKFLRAYNRILNGVATDAKLPPGLCLLITDPAQRGDPFRDVWFATGHCTAKTKFSPWSPYYPRNYCAFIHLAVETGRAVGGGIEVALLAVHVWSLPLGPLAQLALLPGDIGVFALEALLTYVDIRYGC